MEENVTNSKLGEGTTTIGFAAYYNGQKIARSTHLGKLTNNKKVKPLLGKANLIIKHTVPEDVIAVY